MNANRTVAAWRILTWVMVVIFVVGAATVAVYEGYQNAGAVRAQHTTDSELEASHNQTYQATLNAQKLYQQLLSHGITPSAQKPSEVIQGTAGSTGPAGSNATPEEIFSAVQSYCDENNQCTPPAIAGKNGANGTNGTNGQAGADASQSMVAAAVQAYCAANNGCVGPTGATGTAGSNGADGAAGSNGADGAAGADGQPPTSWTYTDALGASYTCSRVADFDASNPQYTCSPTPAP